MTLGMISWIREEDFQRVKAKGLSFVELDVNDRVKEFLDALEQTKEYSKKYDLPVRPSDVGEVPESMKTASVRKSLQ